MQNSASRARTSSFHWSKTRLEKAGKSSLASKVMQVSVSQGDGLGYDVLSFEEDSRERFIEVKTTRSGEYTPFYVSRNEIAVSRSHSDKYYLYRVFAFGEATKFYTRRGALTETFGLEPINFIARIK